ncbi:MAG: protein kinase [Isosphaeraceae bacterium]
MATWNPRANDLFLRALEVKAPDQRRELLDRECADDAALRAEVECLLDADAQASGFLDRPADGLGVARGLGDLPDQEIVPPRSVERVGSAIGPYRLLRQIGEGGMGTVFLAEQAEPIRREVALKVVKPGMDTRQVIARFEAERQALAMMDHVNIARVLDAGTTAAGRPYFVMELVHGAPITEYCDENLLTLHERIELFIPVCLAIQHAHQKGVIHRDVKPSNVLIARGDGEPVPKVIDFGVAKAVDRRLTDRTLFTHHGTMVGTLEYMSPEQAESSVLGVDTRSDVYSLGVLLYELLTGTTPLVRKKMREATYVEVLRMIREVEPPRPSARLGDSGEGLASISARRRIEPGKLTRLVRGELDWIVMKSLEKDRDRRYETATAFAADLRRYLDDEPVWAGPPSRAYRMRKFVRRNRVAALMATVLTSSLLIGSAGMTWQAVRATHAERLAWVNEQKAVARQAEAQTNFALARNAVDTYLSAVTDHPKLNEEDFFELRKELLETAVPFYTSIAERHSDDPKLQAARGHAYHRLAVIRDALGEKEAALADYDAMRTIFARLADRFPQMATYRVDLANSHFNRGNQLFHLARLDEAEAAYRSALEIKKRLRDEYPTISAYRQDHARSHQNLGFLLKELGRYEEAERTLREGLNLQRELGVERLGEPDHRLDLANTWNNLAILLKAMGRTAEAEEAHLAAQRQYRQLAEESPRHRQLLATSLSNYANLLLQLGRGGEAEAAHRAALSARERLVSDFPSVPAYRQELSISHHNLGSHLTHLGRHAEGEAEYRVALSIRQKLVMEFPAVPILAAELGSTHVALAILFRAIDQRQSALEEIDQAIRILEPVVRIRPRLATARDELIKAHRVRARVLDSLERPEEATQARARVIQVEEERPRAKPR